MRPLLWCLLAMWPIKVSEGRAYILTDFNSEECYIFFNFMYMDFHLAKDKYR